MLFTKMKISRIALSLLLAVSAFGADVAGKWKASVEGPNGSMDIVFNFKVDGQKLSGTADGPMGTMPITDGKIDGDKVIFTVEAGDMKILHKGTIAGDEIKMKVDIGDQSMDMTAKRATS